MNIRDEYARLRTFAESKEKWQEIEQLWLIATGHVFRDGLWLKERDSAGAHVTSVAFDKKTWKYIVGRKGADHFKARLDLISELVQEEKSSFSSIEWRVLDGRMAHIGSWEYPLVTMQGMWVFHDKKLLAQVESMLLEYEIGLPVTSLKMKFLH